MDQIELMHQHLRDADGIPALLSAGWEVFELVTALVTACAERSADMYPAFTFTRGAAVSGRNALAFAPSMPAGYAARSGTPKSVTGDVDEVADAVARLASALSARLREAAVRASEAGDRDACENAALDAGQITSLLRKAE